MNDGHRHRIQLIKGRNSSANRLEVGLFTEEGNKLTEGAFEKTVKEVDRTEGQVDGISRCELIDEVISLNKYRSVYTSKMFR